MRDKNQRFRETRNHRFHGREPPVSPIRVGQAAGVLLGWIRDPHGALAWIPKHLLPSPHPSLASVPVSGCRTPYVPCNHVCPTLIFSWASPLQPLDCVPEENRRDGCPKGTNTPTHQAATPRLCTHMGTQGLESPSMRPSPGVSMTHRSLAWGVECIHPQRECRIAKRGTTSVGLLDSTPAWSDLLWGVQCTSRGLL